MENNFAKIKELRLKKTMSQEELAEASGLSLRTIQRIENGETEPRGDSIRRLAAALGVSPDEFMAWDTTENKKYLAGVNFTALCWLINPILGVVFPLVMWLTQKDQIIGLEKLVKKVLNFQITMTVIFYAFVALNYIIIYSVSHSSYVTLPTKELWLAGASGVVAIGFKIYTAVIVVINSLRLLRGGEVKYFPSIRFIRA